MDQDRTDYEEGRADHHMMVEELSKPVWAVERDGDMVVVRMPMSEMRLTHRRAVLLAHALLSEVEIIQREIQGAW